MYYTQKHKFDILEEDNHTSRAHIKTQLTFEFIHFIEYFRKPLKTYLTH